ncbi:TauD/TfdA family dioxygenase [Herbidospora sp. RD11066]
MIPKESLRALAEAKGRLATHGWAVLTEMGFTDGEEVDLGLVRAMVGKLGNITARDGSTEIWPVRADTSDSAETFSRRTGPALLHTDAAYQPDPEPLLMLFCVRPADVGGHTRMLTCQDAITGLPENVDAALREPQWRWTPPKVFDTPPDECHPVLSADDRVRWRYDNLDVPETLKTVAWLFSEHIESHPAVIEFPLKSDSILICDNHRVMHGRTSFGDTERLLLRASVKLGPAN